MMRTYPWHFQDQLSIDWLTVLCNTFHGKGLKRHRTQHEGTFEMIGPRQTEMASSSLVCPPKCTSDHDQFRYSMNRNNMPLVRSMYNQLGHEALHTQFKSGEELMTMQLKARGVKNRDELCPYGILTNHMFCGTAHNDNDCMSHNVTNVVSDYIKKHPNKRYYEYYIRRYQTMFPTEDRYPRPTTCCWKLNEDDSAWHHHQFFLNITCGIAFNLSSTVFSQRTPLIGCTFFGKFIHHCTSIPIYVSVDGSKVRLKPTKKQYNFAWGKTH